LNLAQKRVTRFRFKAYVFDLEWEKLDNRIRKIVGKPHLYTVKKPQTNFVFFQQLDPNIAYVCEGESVFNASRFVKWHFVLSSRALSAQDHLPLQSTFSTEVIVYFFCCHPD